VNERYARQIAVAGAAGQIEIDAAEVTVVGTGLAAEVCARYLVGAGVGRLHVHASMVRALEAANGSVVVEGHQRGGAPRVELSGDTAEAPAGLTAVGAGSSLARWVLAKILGAR